MSEFDDLLRLPGDEREQRWLQERLETLSVREGIILTAAVMKSPPESAMDAINCLQSLDYYDVRLDTACYEELGLGCSPNARGQAVFAVCLGDGEKARWERADFLGVMDEKYLPDWAQERLAELRGTDQDQTDGPAQAGMEMR